MNQLTVNKAIKKGHQMVNYPVFAIMIVGFGLTIYFLSLKLDSIFAGLFGCATFIFMWLWWSLHIVKWKILAFGNVRNVHELKRKAIEQQLIWNDDSWFNKTEIWTNEQKRLWFDIENKFLKEDEFESIYDNGKIPDETILSNSKGLKWLYGAMIVGCLILAITQIRDGQIFMALFLLGVSIYGGVFLLPKVLDITPQIVLSNRGMKIKEAHFVSWNKIKKANVVLQGRGKGIKWYLDIDYRSKDSNGKLGDYIDISYLELNPEKIERLIKIYRLREKKNR